MGAIREGTVRLADGRQLGYAEYGVRGGKPVVLFHGMPGGRAYELERSALVSAGAWLISIERPGIGLSDPHPGGRLMDWPRDVAAFADAFDLERFAVLAFSAGAPWALACAHALAERVAVLGLVCAGINFVDEPDMDHLLPETRAADIGRFREDPEQFLVERLEQLRRRCASWARDPDRFYEKSFGPVEVFWERPRSYWMQLLAATYGRQPGTGDLADLAIEYSPWGFDATQLRVPIHAWHGDNDQMAPLALVEELVRRIPCATLTVLRNENHFLDWSHTDEYLEVLTGW